MLLTPTQARAVLQLAAQERFALLAVNADSPAAITDAIEAARSVAAPIIIETSLWQLQGRSFGAGNPLRGLAHYLAQVALLAADPAFADVPVLFHTDHIKGPQTVPILRQAITGVTLTGWSGSARLRASTLSLDSSAMSVSENIATCADLCAHAQAEGLDLTLEMEAGVDDGLTPASLSTQLLEGIERQHPGVLALYAPGVGTRHGYTAEGFPTFSPAAIAANRDLARRICGRPIGIALHGSSGLGAGDLAAAVAAGVTKVNWSSESLLTRSRAAAAYYRRTELDPLAPTFKAAAMDHGVQQAVSTVYQPLVAERLTILGAAGRAGACLAAAAAASVGGRSRSPVAMACPQGGTAS